jgi:transcriptional regulator with XRE-family HTH domain
MQLGQRIREARTRRSWSQARLAEAACVSQPTVANWENGSHSPREAALERLTRALEVGRLWLLEGQVNGIHTEPAQTPEADSGYFATPILHIPVYPWPTVSEQIDRQALPIRHLAASVLAKEPFAIDCDDRAVSRAFPATTTIVFDRTSHALIDGAFYLFEWNQSVLVRRWRDNPERFEPAGDPGRFDTVFPKERPRILGRAVMAIRCLVD